MELNILFVDNNENALSGMKRMLYSTKEEWNVFFANSRDTAIEIFEKKPIDVIISDIRMPGIDGNHFLKEVKEKYPKTIRITLSGYANDTLALKNSKIVHQSLIKPTNLQKIKNIIERTIELRETLDNEELLKLVNSLEVLPTLPEIYVKLENEINAKETSIERISKIISSDPSITAKILQLTNSAFFGLPMRISNMTQALNFLGIKLIQTLVLTIKLFKIMDSNHPSAKTYLQVWNHSNQVAIISQKIGKTKLALKSDIEYCFLGGLLHDIGKLILLNNFSAEEIGEKFSETIHADVGAYLLGIWGLPEPIIEAVAFHHNPSSAHMEVLSPSKIVYIANEMVSKGNSEIDINDEENFNKTVDEYLTNSKDFEDS